MIVVLGVHSDIYQSSYNVTVGSNLPHYSPLSQPFLEQSPKLHQHRCYSVIQLVASIGALFQK